MTIARIYGGQLRPVQRCVVNALITPHAINAVEWGRDFATHILKLEIRPLQKSDTGQFNIEIVTN